MRRRDDAASAGPRQLVERALGRLSPIERWPCLLTAAFAAGYALYLVTKLIVLGYWLAITLPGFYIAERLNRGLEVVWVTRLVAIALTVWFLWYANTR